MLPGSTLGARCNDIRSEQTRDLLLVVIGTLIALGATTFIKGLRPLIELSVEKRRRLDAITSQKSSAE
jgi:hypothetical protein